MRELRLGESSAAAPLRPNGPRFSSFGASTDRLPIPVATFVDDRFVAPIDCTLGGWLQVGPLVGRAHAELQSAADRRSA